MEGSEVGSDGKIRQVRHVRGLHQPDAADNLITGCKLSPGSAEAGGGSPPGEDAVGIDEVADISESAQGNWGICWIDGGGGAWVEFPRVSRGESNIAAFGGGHAGEEHCDFGHGPEPVGGG